jgi:hypothetical protein
MDTTEAANILRAMYLGAPKGEKVTRIHLFGIKYASELESISLSDLVAQAGISMTYVTEVNKGKKLAKYVTVTE